MTSKTKLAAPSLAAALLVAGLVNADSARACGPLVVINDPDSGSDQLTVGDADEHVLRVYQPDGTKPEGAYILVVEAGKPPVWAAPGVTVDDFVTGLGRNGTTYAGPEECLDPPGGLTFTKRDALPIPKGEDDLTFKQDEGLLIDPRGQPKDGLWKSEIGPTRMEGCPALMQQMFPMSAGALPGMNEGTRRMTFQRPFHPDSLDLSKTARVRWGGAGRNRWVTTDLGAETFAQIPAGEGGGSHIRWTMTVLSPEEISFDRAIEIVLPAEATVMLGASPGGCRVVGTDRWTRVGD
ncbi:hypothetical protein [Roseibium sp.]|uniref:hypothetical protein n=1 Tax=Roseibium sp. TaxID=1936156 RepID=UPI003A97473E